MLRPPDEKVLSLSVRVTAPVIVALLVACAGVPGVRDAPRPVAPPNPSRNTAALDDPADRLRFECAVIAQQSQDFDPGRSLAGGSIIGAVVGGLVGGALGATFGLIGDVPGPSAARGAVIAGGLGIMLGGLISLELDTDASDRGVAACLAARAGQAPTPAPAGLVEYRLRVLNMRHEAFTSFLSSAELADGATGPGLVRLASVADAGALDRGIVLFDRHVTPVDDTAAQSFAATPTAGAVKLASGRRDFWGEARWYGRPGERSVWTLASRNRRPQEVRRVALSGASALAHYRHVAQPLFGAHPEAAVTVGSSYLARLRDYGGAGVYVDGALDGSRCISAVIGVNDDLAFPDRVYFVVNHAASAATYEAVIAWGPRGEDRELPRDR